MKDSALFELISSLSAWEIRNFRRQLDKGMAESRPELSALYEYLTHCHLQKKAPDIEIAAAKTGIAEPGSKAFRYAMSELLEQLRSFLVWQEMQESPCRRELFLLSAMRKRGLEKNFNLAERELDKAFEKIGKASLDAYWIDFQRNQEKHTWNTQHKRGQSFPFEQMYQTLNAWYAGQLMQMLCINHSPRAVQTPNAFASTDWVYPVLEHLPGRPHVQLPGVSLYYLGFEMLSHPEEQQWVSAFQENFRAGAAQIPASEAKGLLMLAINHGIRQINAGNKKAVETTLEFYRFGLESKLLHDERGVLSKYTYNNVLMSYLALERWDDALAFLEQYRAELSAPERDNVYLYNLAIFHFRRGQYDATLDLLRSVSFADPMYNLESRKILLKIYYEQEAIGPLESLLENLLT